MTKLIGMLLAITTIAVVQVGAQQQNQELLHWGVVGGDCQTDAHPCYSQVMKKIAVQRVLLDLAAKPRDVGAVETDLIGSEIKATNLVQLQLIRREGDQYFLNFPLYTAADVRRIRETSERYAGSLAQALLARRAEIESALRSYDAPGVDPKVVAYFVLGCASLDWDGLAVTASKGYRKQSTQKPDGTYVPYAEEKSGISLARIYRGSHNAVRLGVHFTSFGDDESTRFTFPDLLWRLPSHVNAANYPYALQDPLRALLARSLDRTAGQIGHMLSHYVMANGRAKSLRTWPEQVPMKRRHC